MKNTNSEKEYNQEITILLNDIKSVLSSKKDISDTQQLDQLSKLCKAIVENAGILGFNSILNLFSPIEKGVSTDIKQKKKITKNDIDLIIKTVDIAYFLLDDPSVKNEQLKADYEGIKLEIAGAFEQEEEEDPDAALSNKHFQDVFIDEAIDLINQLEEKLLQLESEPTDSELIDNVFRIMHTLKGSSNMFGFKHLGDITHHLENVYDAIRSHKLEVNRSILNITLQCIDHFRNLINDVDLSDQSNRVIQESILNEIEDILVLDEKEQKEINEIQASSNELKTFYLFFKPEANILDDGSNPLYFVYDLNELGTCLIETVASGLPELSRYKPDNCYMGWHILIATNEPAETISENFMFLRETSQPDVMLVGKGNLLEDDALVNKFKAAAIANKSIYSSLNISSTTTSIPQKDYGKRDIKKNKAFDSSIASIRVASAKIDLMMNLISELVTKQAELSMLSNDHDISQLKEVAESIESISRDLRDNAFSISLIPLEKSVLRFQRLVRDVSSKFNKKVDFIVEGKETELDKTIIEKIVDPIMHILRNSIDHGIETPEERKQLGKPEVGTITLKAYPSGAHVVIEITDDGAGINIENVRKVAIKKGYIGSNDEFTTSEMIKLILSPGFSTSENVSEVSGRGVGMDVVYQKISEIRGELDIHTIAGKGTTMTIKLPLTISIIDSLLVMIGDTYYLIPLSVVERCAEVLTPTITESPTQYLNLNGEYIPFIDLHSEFNVKDQRLDYQRLILVKHKNMVIALVVDQIMGNHQAVLKSLGQAYRKQEIISGASILGNGEVALVLDSNKLVQKFMSERAGALEKINLLNSKVQVED
jgi:two-component system chemotaxis sensor kinase CheA